MKWSPLICSARNRKASFQLSALRARRLPAVLGDEGFEVFNLRVPLPARVGRIVDQDTLGACRRGGDLRRNDDDLGAVFQRKHVAKASRRNRDAVGLLDAVCLLGPQDKRDFPDRALLAVLERRQSDLFCGH